MAVKRPARNRTPEAPKAADSASARPTGFPIVGIGASAGGLEAFEPFFAALPSNTQSGMAFVLVQHLRPTTRASWPNWWALHAHAGGRGRGRHGDAAEPRLHHPAQPTLTSCTARCSRRPNAAQAAAADRPLLPLACGRAARARDLRRDLGHRQRRHAGPARRQRRGRPGHGAGARERRIRRHAAQRDRHGRGRLRADAGRDAGPAGPATRATRSTRRARAPHRSCATAC